MRFTIRDLLWLMLVVGMGVEITPFAFVVTTGLALAVSGCRPADHREVPVVAAQVEEPDSPKGEAVEDPELREARDQADEILGGLLAGKFDSDPNLSPVALKLKGYQSCSIKSQKVIREGAANFEGVLDGPTGRRRFAMMLVKQASGNWSIGTFSGPNAE